MTQSTMYNVSIRALSDGHSFSAKHIKSLAEELGVKLLTSAKSIALPCEYAEVSTAESLLREYAMAPLPYDDVILTPEVDGMVVAMAIPRDIVSTLSLDQKAECVPFSPLLAGGTMERGTFIWLSAGVAFIRHYNDGLKLAEAVEVTTIDDLRYLLETLDRAYNIYSTRASVTADTEPWLGSFAQLSKMLNGLFKDVVCEL